MAASRLSTGLMRYSLIFWNSASEISPRTPMTLAARTAGRSPWVSSWTHWAAESARWSYWPGRYSVANTRNSPGSRKSSGYTWSRLGSERMVLTAASNCSWVRPSTS